MAFLQWRKLARKQAAKLEEGGDEAAGQDGITEEERELVRELKARDAEVRRHEAAHAAADPGRISIPRRGDRRGNPIAVPDPLRAGLLADPHAPGCKRFTRDNPDLVQFHPLAASGFYTDIDTPDAYAAFTARAQELAP